MDAAHTLEVHELLSRAAFGYDERNLEVLTACFAADARMVIRVTDQATVGPFAWRPSLA